MPSVTSWLLCFSLSLDLLSYESLFLLKLSGSFLSQTGNLAKTDTKKCSNVLQQTRWFVSSLWIMIMSNRLFTSGSDTSSQNILKSATYWPRRLPPQHRAINPQPSRTLNTCCDSTQKHACYFYSLRVSEQSAPSHATSTNGLLIIMKWQLYVIWTEFLTQVFGNFDEIQN